MKRSVGTELWSPPTFAAGEKKDQPEKEKERVANERRHRGKPCPKDK